MGLKSPDTIAYGVPLPATHNANLSAPMLLGLAFLRHKKQSFTNVRAIAPICLRMIHETANKPSCMKFYMQSAGIQTDVTRDWVACSAEHDEEVEGRSLVDLGQVAGIARVTHLL